MVGDDVVNVTEQRYLVTADNLNDFQYPVVKFLADTLPQFQIIFIFPKKIGTLRLIS